MEHAINKQINAELYSAYLYLSMNAYFHFVNLEGFANWMRIQALEEMTHADRLYRYLLERGGRAAMEPIEGPQHEWSSPLAAFEDVLKHEQKVTGLINALMDLAIEERDHASASMLGWFVDEQVEEEAGADGIVRKLRLVGSEGSGLFMLDRELGGRVFVPPAQAQE
jgi:ferritin